MEDKNNRNLMNEDALEEVAGGAASYDFYGNPIPNHNSLSCSLKNADGATYACPSCGSTRFKIRSADDRNINLKCKDCGTTFTVANLG